jgi:putative nucleotidyltransferase with HDIG domain
VSSTAVRVTPSEGSVGVLISSVASLATALLVLTWNGAWEAASAKPVDFACYLVVTAALMLLAVDIYGRGSISVAGIGLLSLGFTFGVGAAVWGGIFAAGVHAIRRRSQPHKALFNAATFALASGAGAGVFALVPHGSSTVASIVPAILAGVAFWAVNIGLLTLVMSLSQGLTFLKVWNDGLRWLTPHYVAFGPLALASAMAYEKLGITGLVAFAVPPALLVVSVRQYLAKTRESVAEVERANEELRRTNADLQDLFQFAAGLAAQTHDQHALALYARDALERLVGARVKVAIGTPVDGATPLEVSGRVVGGITLEGGDPERWSRLREAILPQLATALESALLVEEVRKTHLDTIAALSRSMEAKDYYTGGHTERVSGLAVALARRLGYEGTDLDAIEIGALLHDIGKIGIPEGILHKEGPLDDDEWVVMKKHPVISEFILSEIDLPAIVLQIARSSHERIDGTGYPDGLAGDEVPLPARIVLVADAYDALTSDRPYRRARLPRAAFDEIRAHSGAQFCPRVVEALERVFREEPGVLGTRLAAVA